MCCTIYVHFSSQSTNMLRIILNMLILVNFRFSLNKDSPAVFEKLYFNILYMMPYMVYHCVTKI